MRLAADVLRSPAVALSGASAIGGRAWSILPEIDALPGMPGSGGFRQTPPDVYRAKSLADLRKLARRRPRHQAALRNARAFAQARKCEPGGARWTVQQGTGAPRSADGSAASARVSETEAELHDLMVRGLAGDGAAHQRLLDVLSVRFRTFFRNRLQDGDPSQAEDLVQETLIAIHTRGETYNPARPVTAWVYAIARYKLIDHFRRTRTRGVSVPVDEVAELFSSERADATEPARDVAVLLDQLPLKQRTAIRLVKLEELSVREAAARTGLTESDIKISIHRGMKKLSTLVAKGTS